MSKALWPAVSGAMARDHQVDVIANNLANVNTNGFKRDDVSFKEYMAADEKMMDIIEDIPRSPIKDKDLYPMNGRDQSFVVIDGTHTKFSPGALKVTDNPLDVALEGKGFLEVSTPQGVRYTRAGNLKIGPQGRLMTSEGFAVLAAGGDGAGTQDPNADVSGRYINLSGRDGMVQIGQGGEIFMNEEKVAQLSVVEFANINGLQKAGNALFEVRSEETIPQAATETLVRQGVIETSNVNPVQEISNLIRANRMFEQNLKSIKTVSEMMSKEVNDIAKF